MASAGNIDSSEGVTSIQSFEEFKPRREYDKFRSFIDFNELDSEMKTGTLRGFNRYITNNFNSQRSNKTLIIGVAGNTGAGKSSLINALQGLKPQDKGAAPVGNTETTIGVQEYPYTKNARIVLKDFPGVGSPNFPKEGYLEKTKLLNSNVVIVVSSVRFTENDIWIAKNAIEKQRNVLFVRTKVDDALVNSKHDYPDTFNEYQCLSLIREDMEKNIEQLNMNLQTSRDVIYLVSTREKTYDLDKLAGTLTCVLNVESSAICQLLYEHMEQTIKSKTRKAENSFFGRKVLSTIAGIPPIPMLESSLDTYHVKAMVEVCKRKYCIDEESLKMIAKELNTTENDLKGKLVSYGEETSDGERLHSDTEDTKWTFLQKYSKYLVPGFGSLFSAYKSSCTMQECLEKICKVMENDELMLVRARLEMLRKDLRI